MSDFGTTSSSVSSFIEGMAMTNRIRTGMIVQAISRGVLCVVREGTGFAVSLKRTAM